jgi:hypothetical protein
MSVLLQYGGGGPGNVGGFLVSVFVVVGIPIAVFLLGRLFESVF